MEPTGSPEASSVDSQINQDARRSSLAGSAKVTKLCALGFSAAAVRLALQRQKGNAERAGVWLLDKRNLKAVQEAEAEVAAAFPITVGCTARIGGLRGATQLNGTTVTVERYDEEDQRWIVRPPSADPISIRPRFLERLDAESTAFKFLAAEFSGSEDEEEQGRRGSKNRRAWLRTQVGAINGNAERSVLADLTLKLKEQSERFELWKSASDLRVARLEAREATVAVQEAEWRELAKVEAAQLCSLEQSSAQRGADAVQQLAHTPADLGLDQSFKEDRDRLIGWIQETEEATRDMEKRDAETEEKLLERELRLVIAQAEQRQLIENIAKMKSRLQQRNLLLVHAALRSKPSATATNDHHTLDADAQETETASGAVASSGDSDSSDEVWDLDWNELVLESATENSTGP